MKRLFIACLVILLLAVALVAAIEYDTGYLLLSYGNYTLESSVWVGLLFFLLLFAVVYGFFSFIRRTINTSTRFGLWFSGRGSRRNQQQTTKGYIALIEGNWVRARRLLSRSAPKSDAPLVNYIAAAQASHGLGNDDQVKEFLKKADQSTSGASIAVGLTQARLQLRRGKYEQGLATLKRLRKDTSKHPYVLDLLKDVYVGLNDWQEVMVLVPELRKHKLLPVKELDELEIKSIRLSIKDVSNIRGDVLSELTALWQRVPKYATQKGDIVAAYAEQVMSVGGMQIAEKLLRNQLNREWDSRLVTLYGKVAGDDSSKQLLHAENWLKERNSDAALFLCLGRLSLRNSLWGKAKEYFENSLKAEESSEVCAELGRLLAHLGEHEKSNGFFQRGLLLAAGGLIELPMPSKATPSK